MDSSSLDGRLLFAIPKKGRLHEKCLELLAGQSFLFSHIPNHAEFLQGADIQFRRHHRLDISLVLNHPIAL
jgi:ATP phosphoribosyltransferase